MHIAEMGVSDLGSSSTKYRSSAQYNTIPLVNLSSFLRYSLVLAHLNINSSI